MQRFLMVVAFVAMSCNLCRVAQAGNMLDDIARDVKDSAKQEINSQVNNTTQDAKRQLSETTKESSNKVSSGFFSDLKNMFSGNSAKEEPAQSKKPSKNTAKMGD